MVSTADALFTNPRTVRREHREAHDVPTINGGVDLEALWHARQQAGEAFDAAADGSPEERAAWERYIAAGEAIRAARPRTLAGFAIQARLLEDSIATGYRKDDVVLARSIAEQLERLGRRPADRGGAT
jgi:hypothetical protein